MKNDNDLTARQLLGVIEIQIVRSDFETAAYSSMRSLFPQLSIECCFFHFGETNWRKISELLNSDAHPHLEFLKFLKGEQSNTVLRTNRTTSYNVSLNWINSYLSSRKQCIVEKNKISKLQIVKSGVPQGSVLGPVLFLLFINDLPLFTNETEVDIYADDTTMHTANVEYKNVEKDLQRGASGFQGWCKANKMYINVSKTTCMALGWRQNLSRIEASDICLEKELIQKVEQQKLLGVIDMSLSWDKQIDSVCLNISRRITLLKILSKYIDKTSMNQYYNSYILPILDYGCLIWGRCTKSNILRLLKLQKKSSEVNTTCRFTNPFGTNV